MLIQTHNLFVHLGQRLVLESINMGVEKGEVVNPKFLRQIASTTEGSFLDGNNTSSTVEAIKDALLTMEKGDSETEMFEDYEDQFQWFLIGAMLMLIISLFVGEGKTSWLRKLNL